jgi:hypothetical protein
MLIDEVVLEPGTEDWDKQNTSRTKLIPGNMKVRILTSANQNSATAFKETPTKV